MMWPSSALRRQGKADKMEKPGGLKNPPLSALQKETNERMVTAKIWNSYEQR